MFAAQILSAASNFVVSFMAARTATAGDFGVFSLLSALLYAGLTVHRSIVSESLLARLPTLDAAAQESMRRDATRVALATSALGGVFFLGCWFFLPPHLNHLSPLFALLSIGMYLQDVGRYAAIAMNDGRRAVRLEVWWLVPQLTVIASLAVLGNVTLGGLAIAWTAGAVLSAWHANALDWRTDAGAWARWRRRWSKGIASYAFIHSTLAQLSGQISLVALASIVGLAAFGSLRATQTLFAPLASFLAMGVTLLTPRMARAAEDPHEWRRLSIRSGALAGIVGLLVFLFGWLGAASLGSVLLGPDYPLLPTLAPWVAAAVGLQLASVPTGAGLRGAVQYSAILKLQLVSSVFGISIALALAAAVGVVGAAVGFAVQWLITLGGGWWYMWAYAARSPMLDAATSYPPSAEQGA